MVSPSYLLSSKPQCPQRPEVRSLTTIPPPPKPFSKYPNPESGAVVRFRNTRPSAHGTSRDASGLVPREAVPWEAGPQVHACRSKASVNGARMSFLSRHPCSGEREGGGEEEEMRP